MLELVINLLRTWRLGASSRSTRVPAGELAKSDDRFSEIKQRLTYETVPVSGGNNLVWFVLCMLLSVLLVANALRYRELIPILGALGFLGLSAAFLLTLIPRLGKPALTLTRAGLLFPTYGLIPWSAIKSVTMERLQTTYGPMGHMLNVEVPSLPTLIHQMHPATRLLYRTTGFGRRRTLISLRLVRTSVPAVTLLAAIDYLRAEARGRAAGEAVGG